MSLTAAILLPPHAPAWLRALAGVADPFRLWMLILVGLGYSTMHKTAPAKGYAATAALLVAFVATALAVSA